MSRFHLMPNRAFQPTRFLTVGFALIILLGSLLLCLPVSSQSGEFTPWLDCLFTATSATCVTGLIVEDTGLYWSTFGQVVILCLIQLGGLGFVSMIALVFLALHRRIGLTQRLAISSALGMNDLAGVVRVVKNALIGTCLLELAGAALLSLRFVPMFGLGRGLWYSVFHSISAFCNAGFDILGSYSGAYASVAGFTGDVLVLGVIMSLIAIGGLGFFVWEDVVSAIRHKRKLRFYSRIVLTMTGALILLGTVFFLCVEWSNPDTLGPMSPGEKLLNAMFQSITLRTAGYASLDQGALRESSAAMSVVLMLVGGSSGSTAGGIKTATVAVLLLSLLAGLRGRDEVVLRRRTIPHARVLSAMTLALLVLLLTLTGAMILAVGEGLPFLECAFEAASAMGTVGVTMGITPELGAVSKVTLVTLMYLGRVGILSFSMAFLLGHRGVNKLHYPSADVLIG